MEKIISKMLDYLEKASVDNEYTTAKILKDIHPMLPFSNRKMIEIDAKLRNSAKERNLILDSSQYKDMIIGLPFNIPFTVRKIK